MSVIHDLLAGFSERGLCPEITNHPCDVRSCIAGFGLTDATIQKVADVDDRAIEAYYRQFPKKIAEMKMIRNCCLSGKVVYPNDSQVFNDEGVPVFLSTLAGHTHIWYCGRDLGMAALPGSDGHCGPYDGPNCWACQHVGKLRDHANTAKQGTGACIAIGDLNRKLAKATHRIETLVKAVDALQASQVLMTQSQENYKAMYEVSDADNAELQQEYNALVSKNNRLEDENLQLKACNAEFDDVLWRSDDKRKRVDTNEVLTDLCSGEVPGSLTDIEEALRQARQLVLNLDAQVLTMRADKERREAAEKILAKKRAQAEEDPPEYLKCSISHELMVDPVMTGKGHTFERKEIENWLLTKQTCPKTREPLKKENLIPNLSLRDAIEAYVAAQVVPE
jgi:hypothetical protein